jgi:hypothetical protein
MALEANRPLTERSARNISFEVKAACDRQPHHIHVMFVWKCGSLNLLKPSQPIQAFRGIAYPYLYFYFRYFWHYIDISKALCEFMCHKSALGFLYAYESRIYVSTVYKVITYWTYRWRDWHSCFIFIRSENQILTPRLTNLITDLIPPNTDNTCYTIIWPKCFLSVYHLLLTLASGSVWNKYWA